MIARKFLCSNLRRISPGTSSSFCTKVPEEKKTNFVLRLRGLPVKCSEMNVKQFFGETGKDITEVQLLKDAQGRQSDSAYIVLNEIESYKAAKTMHNKELWHHYVEVIDASEADLKDLHASYVLQMRKLLWTCTVPDIKGFFKDIAGDINRVQLFRDPLGAANCTAYVVWANETSMKKGLARNKETFMERPSEIARSNAAEMRLAIEKSGFTLRKGYKWSY